MLKNKIWSQNLHKAKSLKIIKYIINPGSKKANKNITFKGVVYSCNTY